MKRPDVSFLDRLLGKTRDAAVAARRAELEGDLERAAHLWAEADRADEAARVTLLRGDGELDSAKRLFLYVQAVSLAPEGHAVRDIARRKRALLSLGIAREGATSAAARLDLHEAGKELEALGDAMHAAEAYALAGDFEGEARALVGGGEIERLEDMLTRDQDRVRSQRSREGGQAEVGRLLAHGQRREALARAEELAAATPGDGTALERARSIRARVATGPRVAIELRGTKILLVVGEEVVLGRNDGAILVPSHAVSRKHLAITRGAISPVGGAGPEEAILVRDLGSRNGTELRGMRIAGTIPVAPNDGLELKLGGEVPLRLSPSDEIAGALAIEVAGVRYVASLGPARLGVGMWTLEMARDGWVELVTQNDPTAYLGATQLETRTPLLVGDVIAARRGEAGVLRVS
jgi:hypothetical protein